MLATVSHINNTIIPEILNEIVRVTFEGTNGEADPGKLGHLITALSNWKVRGARARDLGGHVHAVPCHAVCSESIPAWASQTGRVRQPQL